MISKDGCLRHAMLVTAAFVLLGAATASAFAANEASGSASGLPVPRFVSLKSDKVNVRGGPTKDHEVTWMYTRAGLPVEVTAEFENWRRIRDWEGAEGWVYHSLLSGRRTAVVNPRTKSKEDLIPLHEKADAQSAVAAKLQAGVLGSVKRCTNGWCRLTGEGYDGWVQQERLWGVYPDEKVD
jgi:SH3-like domain-containing protein